MHTLINQDREKRRAIYRAIDACGGNTAMARAIGANSPAVVSMWAHRGNIPARWVIAVEQASGVSRHDLRPDIYPRQ